MALLLVFRFKTGFNFSPYLENDLVIVFRKFAGHHNVERRYWQMQRSCVHNRAGCNGKAVVDTTYGEVAAIFM
ncbi:unnamed protein product [Urochloa humidicola]